MRAAASARSPPAALERAQPAEEARTPRTLAGWERYYLFALSVVFFKGGEE